MILKGQLETLVHKFASKEGIPVTQAEFPKTDSQRTADKQEAQQV